MDSANVNVSKTMFDNYYKKILDLELENAQKVKKMKQMNLIFFWWPNVTSAILFLKMLLLGQ